MSKEEMRLIAKAQVGAGHEHVVLPPQAEGTLPTRVSLTSSWALWTAWLLPPGGVAPASACEPTFKLVLWSI